MRLYRIYADAELCAGTELALSGRAAHHLVTVLRHRVGDRVKLFDGRGLEATAEITAAHRRQGCSVRVIEAADVSRESHLQIELLQGLSRGEKLDLVIQKAVELGTTAIRPIIAERSEVRPNHSAAVRLARWREIATGACEQSGRTRLPEVHAPVPLKELTTDAATRLVLDPVSDAGLADLAPFNNEISIAIGPEGGFSGRELAIFEDNGFTRVRFGPRVLRTETAGIAAVAALQVLYGDLAG